jgi:hypothetical protein
MATKSIRLADLAGISREEIEARLTPLSAGLDSPLNGELEELNSRIGAFEDAYQMDSERMRTRVTSGEMSETADVCQWLILVKLRDRIARKQSCSSRS